MALDWESQHRREVTQLASVAVRRYARNVSEPLQAATVVGGASGACGHLIVQTEEEKFSFELVVP